MWERRRNSRETATWMMCGNSEKKLCEERKNVPKCKHDIIDRQMLDSEKCSFHSIIKTYHIDHYGYK